MKSLPRTWIALLLCAATLLCAVACGSEKIAPTANEESASEETGESTDTTEEVKMTDANETLAPTETVTDTADGEMSSEVPTEPVSPRGDVGSDAGGADRSRERKR